MVQEVRSQCRLIAANFTRPADTTAYASGDVLCNSTSAPVILTFARATNGELSSSMLMSATIISSANQPTKPDLRLWLFDTTVTMDNDNAAFTPTDAEMRTLLQVVAFPASAWLAGDASSGAGGNAVCNAQALWLPINTVGGDNAIYGVLTAGAAYTPVSGERFDVRLGFVD